MSIPDKYTYAFHPISAHATNIQLCDPQGHYAFLSNDVASDSEITPCIKIDKPLVVYKFSGNVMTFITMLRT